MLIYNISVWGVIVAALAVMVLGMVWYSPALFGKKWMELVGMTPESAAKTIGNAWKSYVASIILSLVMVYILGIFIENTFTLTLKQTVVVGFLAWLGFAAPSMANEYLYTAKSKPWSLYAINAGYQLASLVIASVVLFFFMS